MKRIKESIYHPLSFFSTIEGRLNNLLEDLESQWKVFAFVRDNPGTADEGVIKSSQELLKKNPEDIAIYQEQISRWTQEAQGGLQQKDLGVLAQKLSKIRALNSKLLDLTKYLSRNTFSKEPERSDKELV